MTKLNFYIFFLSLILVSCEKKPKYNYENLILGDLIFENEIPKRENYFVSDYSYSFAQNENCVSKPGYYGKSKKNEREEQTIFYGTNTKYRIVEDSLYILNLVSKKWDASRIVGITSKNLKLKFDKSVILNFSKINYDEIHNESFDKLIISKSPCFGPCPINDIEINKNGEIYYHGSSNNLKNGFFKSKIKRNEFEDIEMDFNKANFIDLKVNYSANWTDDQQVSVTFVKDNKIVKTITDYGRQAPKLFRINVEPLTYLYQNIQLEENKNINKFQQMFYFNFGNNNEVIILSDSESFFLFNLLSNAKKTNKSFKSEYFKNYDTVYDVQRIESDGRYFRIMSKNKSFYTLDLGFNFIEKNELAKRILMKTELE